MSRQSSEFLFLAEVAALARVSVSTVRHWVLTGKLPSIRPGRRRLVRRADVVALLGPIADTAVAEDAKG